MKTIKAQKLIDVYLDWIMTPETDAGWHSGSILGKWHDFQGDLPQSSGYMPTDSMEREIRYLRTPHRLLPEAREVFDRMPKGLRDPLLSWELYKNRGRQDGDEIVGYSQRYLADWMGIKEETYKQKVSKARAWLAEYGEEQAKAA